MTDPDLITPTMQLMLDHRSVRRFQDRPLPDGLLESLIACGQKASTSSNLQTCTVVHVADPDRKKELARLCGDQVQIHQSAAFLAFCGDLHRLHIAHEDARADRETGRFDGDYAEALLVATVDVALFMQNVAVAAESAGLGICFIGAMRNHPEAVGKLLELPPFVYAVSGLCLGYPAEAPSAKPRLPLDAVLHRERYLDDAAHRHHLDAYDRTMADFYTGQGMHPKDPRWTRTMAGRVEGFHDRAELDAFLRQQGFNLRNG